MWSCRRKRRGVKTELEESKFRAADMLYYERRRASACVLWRAPVSIAAVAAPREEATFTPKRNKSFAGQLSVCDEPLQLGAAHDSDFAEESTTAASAAALAIA